MAAERKPKSAEPVIEIKLSPTQVEKVVRAVKPGRTPGFAEMITTVLSAEAGAPASDNPRTSRSLLRGLAVLACFDANDESLGFIEIADRLGINPHTIRRYLLTLVQVGLLEQSEETRRYSLATTRKRRA
jgi:predicted transcriptional regulator